jgi:hypothetical protein
MNETGAERNWFGGIFPFKIENQNAAGTSFQFYGRGHDGVNTPFRARSRPCIFCPPKQKTINKNQLTYEINYHIIRDHHPCHIGSGRLQPKHQ